MFKVLMLQALDGFSDDQADYKVASRFFNAEKLGCPRID
jgi:hypothetical protein